MGMLIDEAIKYLRALKRCETCEEGDIGRCKSCSCYRIGSSAKCYDAIDVGVDTMQKYQKIVPALVNYDLLNPIADVKTIDGEGIYINLSDLQDYIQKVIENGNDD